MSADGARGQALTRREALWSLGAALAPRDSAGRGHLVPPERVRFADPATEFPVLRLTDPSNAGFLPAATARAVTHNGAFLLYSSDRTGSPQAFRMDVRSGESLQLTEAAQLDVRSLTWMPDDRSCVYFDGSSLRLLILRNLKEKEVYRVPEGFERGAGFHVAADGSRAVFVERRGGVSYLRLVRLPRGGARTVLESRAPLSDPVLRPGREGILYRSGPAEPGPGAKSVCLAEHDGRRNRQLAVAAGRTGQAFWARDGRSLLYLNFPENARELNSIREMEVETNTERLVARTSQFVRFCPNNDGSVFVGAGGSKASPYILLLLRVTRRELAVCEHRASDPARVEPVFSPDSQRIYFQSDRHGKSALYCAVVDRLVERTES